MGAATPAGRVKIQVDQPIAAPVQDVQAAFLDPGFYASLGELPGISAPEVRSLSRIGPCPSNPADPVGADLGPAGAERARIVLGYRFSGTLNGPARRLLDPAKLTWSQVSEVDLVARRTAVELVPDNYAGLFSFTGWYELRAQDDARSSQHFEGDLRVHLPVLGPLAERAIAGSIRQNLAATAKLVERYLSGRAPGNQAAEPPGG
jgi:hypothetical protein